VRMNLNKTEQQIIVKVLEKHYDLADFTLKNIPKSLYEWELGGITDPLGQLISWLWDQINTALKSIRATLESVTIGVRDTLSIKLSFVMDTLSSRIDVVGVLTNLSLIN